MKRAIVLLTSILVILLVVDVSFARKKKAVEINAPQQAFSPETVNDITVLPVADVRKDKSVKLKKLTQIGQKTVKRNLKKSTYTLAFHEDFGGVPDINEDDIEYADASWVKQLGVQGDRYVLLLVLEDAARKATLGSAFGTVCSGYLYDTEQGVVMWQSKHTGSMGQGGLIGLVMNNMMRSGAFRACALQVMADFPRMKKSKEKKS